MNIKLTADDVFLISSGERMASLQPKLSIVTGGR
jgi:hypothetical protein